jgi:glycosyltransferase involved in cell wall biosynthesis
MRIMLAMTLSLQPALGGASKANRRVCEMLGARGHTIRALFPSGLNGTQETNRSQKAKQRPMLHHHDLNGFEAYEVESGRYDFHNYFATELAAFNPDIILLSSEDPMHLLLNEAVKYDACRTVYLAHTPNCLPFGPASFDSSDRGYSLLSKVGAIVAVSRFCQDYIQTWSSLSSTQIYLPVYGSAPFPKYENIRRGYITMINPCDYKGISIFSGLAESLPDISFAAVPSWGTTRDDLVRLSSINNVTLLKANPSIDEILKVTSILLVPSLYLENFPMIIIEAMLRGIPVLASDVGGIPEAKLGTKNVLEVTPIGTYGRTWDENGLWRANVPVQSIEVWHKALSSLIKDSVEYQRESEASRDAACAFVKGLTLEPFEDLLHDLDFKNS